MKDKKDEIASPNKDITILQTAAKEPKIEEKSSFSDEITHRLGTVPVIDGLDKLATLKDQVDSHYIASLIYKDLEKHLTDRNSIVDEFKAQLDKAKEEYNKIDSDKKSLAEQLEKVATKQQECLKEYQEGELELEEERKEITSQIEELEKQIEALKKRKMEIAEQQNIRLKDQDNTQQELQNDIDKFAKDIAELANSQNQIHYSVQKLVLPKDLANLDSRITDMVHHICVIFEANTPTDFALVTPPGETPPGAKTGTKNKEITTANDGQTPIIQLDPWIAEDNKGLTSVQIPVNAKQIILSLHIPENKTYERYASELYASNGRRVWNSDKLDINGKAIVITFNSTFFLCEDYEMRLRGRNSERTFSPIAEYYFRVTKKL